MRTPAPQKLAAFLTCCYKAIFLCLYLFVCVKTLQTTASEFPASPLFYGCTVLLWAALLAGVYRLLRLVKGHPIRTILLMLAVLSAQVFYAWCVYTSPGADAGIVWYIAHVTALGTEPLDAFFYEYLAMFQNNIPLLLLLRTVYEILQPPFYETSWLLQCLVATCFADAAVLFTYLLAKEMLQDTRAALALGFCIPLILLSESAAIAYTCIASLWAIPAGLYCFTKALEGKKALWWAGLSGCCFAWGILFKPNVAVGLVALVIAAVLLLLKCSRLPAGDPLCPKNILRCVLGLLVSVAIASALMNIPVNQFKNSLGEELLWENEHPVAHWVFMGLNEEYHGGWNEEDSTATAEVIGLENKTEFLREQIKIRLAEYDIPRLLQHFATKLEDCFTVGTMNTFTITWRGEAKNEDPIARSVQQWTMVTEPYYTTYTAVFIQMGYLLVTFLCLLGLLLEKKGTDRLDSFLPDTCRISLIGIALFLLLFEKNIRYIYTMLPCMILLAVYGMDHIIAAAKTIFRK